MASRKCASRKVGIFFVSVGVIIFFVAIIVLVAFPYIYQSKLQTSLALTDGSLLFNLWKDVPIPIYQKFYFFNITNARQFKRGEKLKVQEVGPYVYKCRFVKEDIAWHENKTLSYRERRTYVFDEEKSVGFENDTINTLNGPLIMAADYIKDLPAVERAIAGMIFGAAGENLIIEKTIKELTYTGYEDFIIKYGKYIRTDLPYKNSFAWLYGQNDTDDGIYNVYTGEDDLGKLNIIDMWKGSHKLKFWKNDTCNMINGSNGEVSPPLKENQQQLSFFQSFICRSLTFNYTKEISHLNLDGKRFEITRDVFANETINPDNACYNTKPYLPSGVQDLGACQYGAPVVLSSPHFYLADPLYLTKIDGICPNESLHKSYMDLMSLVGFGTEMAIRLQINAYVRQDKSMLQLNKVSTGVYPIFWMEISGKVTQWLANYVNGKIQDPKTIAYSLVGVISGLAMILITVGIVFILISPKTDSQGKICEDDPLLESKTDVKRYSSVSGNIVNSEQKENSSPPQLAEIWIKQDGLQPADTSYVSVDNSINQQNDSKDVPLLDT